MPPVSIEVKMINWHGMSDDGMLWDLVHSDGTRERITIGAEKYGDFKIGESPERISSIMIMEWAPGLITKDEFHDRFGKGRFLHPQKGHYVDEKDLPDHAEKDEDGSLRIKREADLQFDEDGITEASSARLKRLFKAWFTEHGVPEKMAEMHCRQLREYTEEHVLEFSEAIQEFERDGRGAKTDD